MYPNIVCFCGRSIGHLYNLFIELKRDMLVHNNINPTYIPITEESNCSLAKIFKILNIDSDCCKIRLMTNKEFASEY